MRIENHVMLARLTTGFFEALRSFLSSASTTESPQSLKLAATSDLTKPTSQPPPLPTLLPVPDNTGTDIQAQPKPGIDFSFIARLEGGSATRGYVPNPEDSKSGVTIATGFDLGQRSRSELVKMGLPSYLIARLEPYLGVQQQEAVRLLQDKPLHLTTAEAELIDEKYKSQFLERLAQRYNQSIDDSLPRFEELPSQAQTVIASVAFQYGLRLNERTPKFWHHVTHQNWAAAVAELNNFGDKYPTRRHQEANLLSEVI